ncbi:MAG: hypothetical protein IT372_20910 [Polyangiaceae bacterium]|nr:hypothetical protein [Polyangiaceae bacterium]
MSPPGPTPRAFSAKDLVALLAPTIGQEKSRDAVLAAARALGLEGDALAFADALSILESLSVGGGILAVAARFARERIASKPARPAPGSGSEPQPGARPSASIRPPSVLPPPPGCVTAAKLKAHLAPALGLEKSEQLVAEAMHHLGLDSAELTAEQAMAILDHLAAVPGLIGVTARFARARFPRVLGN